MIFNQTKLFLNTLLQEKYENSFNQKGFLNGVFQLFYRFSVFAMNCVQC